MVSELLEKVLSGDTIDRTEAVKLIEEPLEELVEAADRIRRFYCDNAFDVCTIINGKCGKCSEDCKYCAQSAHNNVDLKNQHPLVSTEEILNGAKKNACDGIGRYSIVTSGRRLSEDELNEVCESIKKVRHSVDVEMCVSFGLLGVEDFKKIKKAGASRVHCNLETSRRFFPNICTTHSYDEKIETIKAASEAGLSVCSGGIIGLGETMEDRIDMVLTARELGVKSVPVNILNPIPGTPFEGNERLSYDEIIRTVAIFRFLIPDGNIRMAGGRGLLPDKGERCFLSGANAAISGDMLTTSGITFENDKAMLNALGYETKLC